MWESVQPLFVYLVNYKEDVEEQGTLSASQALLSSFECKI